MKGQQEGNGIIRLRATFGLITLVLSACVAAATLHGIVVVPMILNACRDMIDEEFDRRQPQWNRELDQVAERLDRILERQERNQ